MVKVMGFTYLETWNLNQEPLENTFIAVYLNCGVNDNRSEGQFVDALRLLSTVVLLLYNCAALSVRMMVNWHFLLWEFDVSSSDLTTCHCREVLDGVTDMFYIAEQVQWKFMCYTSDVMNKTRLHCRQFHAVRQPLCGVNCDTCQA